MLCYFQCKKCNQVSDLFLEKEAESFNPSCNTCAESGGSVVEKKTTFAFFFGCRTCWKTWRWCTPSSYASAKAARPDCPLCRSNKEIYFVPAQITPKKAEKRKRQGMLDDPQHDPGLYDTLDVEERLVHAKRTRLEAPAQKEAEFIFTPVEEPSLNQVSRMEGSYKRQRARQKAFIKRFGEVQPKNDPKKTSQLKKTGRVVKKADYDKTLKSKVKVKGTEYKRQMASAPTVVTDVRILDRSLPWDYRELGPNSFLRRLSSLVYMIHFGIDDRSLYPDKESEAYKKAAKQFKASDEKYKPVEVQAMWAGKSLYLSSNNNLYSEKLLEALQAKASVKALVGDINLGSGGAYKALARNFGKGHVAKMKEYQAAITTNTESSYRSYFLFQWTYVFQQLREAIEFTDIDSVTIKRTKAPNQKEATFDSWTIEPTDKALTENRVFVVLPETGTPKKGLFVNKEVHAEELFYPILMELDAKGRLTEQAPAFIGGVKTACFTCATVLQTAAQQLQKKLVLPTDAYGHYWENSGKHVPALTFTSNTQTIVFSDNQESLNFYDTEMPMSPKSPDHS